MSEGMKWRVNRAVRQSTLLPAPARHIMLTLAERAKPDTAAIPPEFSPSTAELVAETGQKETTVKKYRAFLEVHGWLKVDRPNGADKARHVPSTYQLAIGDDCDGVACEHSRKQPEGRLPTLETTDRGSSDDPRRGPRNDPGNDSEGRQTTVARVARRPSRGSGDDPLPITTDRDHQNHQLHGADAQGTDGAGALFDVAPGAAEPSRQTKARKSATRSPEDEARSKLADEITRQWWERLDKKPVGKNAFIARRQIVLALLEAGHEPDAVAEAAKRSGISMTTGGMEYQLQRIADEAARAANVVPFQRANGHQPYQNPTDHSVYFGAIS